MADVNGKGSSLRSRDLSHQRNVQHKTKLYIATYCFGGAIVITQTIGLLKCLRHYLKKYL